MTRLLSLRLAHLSLLFALPLAVSPQAKATTIFLDFVTSSTNDAFAVNTTQADFVTEFGFVSLNNTQIKNALLNAVIYDFLGYPTTGANALSPLPNGKQLNVNFLLAGTASADPEFYLLDIGNGSSSFFGQACLACIRTNIGGGPSAPNGARFGSIISNAIATSLASLATSDAQRLNLLTGTISHEIGHAFSLDHPAGQLPNPGASLYSLEATGVTPASMPADQRILDRAFAYSEFTQLISAIGLTDAPVPEPATLSMFGVGVSFLIGIRMRRSRR